MVVYIDLPYDNNRTHVHEERHRVDGILPSAHPVDSSVGEQVASEAATERGNVCPDGFDVAYDVVAHESFSRGCRVRNR